MKAFKRIMSMALAVMMVLSICPVSIFAADTSTAVNANTNAPKTYDMGSDDYYYRYTFDNAAVETAPKLRYVSGVSDPDSNPYNMSSD